MIRFYDTVISPYKGQLEAWWVKNQSLNYFLLIVLTIWVILFPKSTIPYSPSSRKISSRPGRNYLSELSP